MNYYIEQLQENTATTIAVKGDELTETLVTVGCIIKTSYSKAGTNEPTKNCAFYKGDYYFQSGIEVLNLGERRN